MRFLTFLILFPSFALASPSGWEAPMKLNDSNISLEFEVDSTWHLIKGKTVGVEGSLNIASDELIEGAISVPVAKFDTDNSSRDERLREVMNEPDFKVVQFKLINASPICKPSNVEEGSACSGLITGDLTIRNITKTLDVPYSVSYDNGSYTAKGSFQIQWEDYGVEDPSILIAKLDPTVSITFEIKLKKAIQ